MLENEKGSERARLRAAASGGHALNSSYIFDRNLFPLTMTVEPDAKPVDPATDTYHIGCH